jgi:hypothetical protein
MAQKPVVGRSWKVIEKQADIIIPDAIRNMMKYFAL